MIIWDGLCGGEWSRMVEMVTSSTCDEQVKNVLPIFAKAGVPVAFLVITPTGYEKSIMDAVAPLRNLLYDAGLHNYNDQLQGQEHKKILPAVIIAGEQVIETKASLYRPRTKMGDPRIWFAGLKKHCKPNDILAVITVKKEIYVFVLNQCLKRDYSTIQNVLDDGVNEAPQVFYSLTSVASEILQKAVDSTNSVAKELFNLIEDIHRRGFVRAITHGDTAVGMTLEHYLGIPPNDSKLPDYKGIELKAARMDKNFKQKNRMTLFTQVPDWKASRMTEALLLRNYGYWGKDQNGNKRWNLYCTVSNIPNPQGLFLAHNPQKDLIINYYQKGLQPMQEVVQWNLELLRRRTLQKHHETFWVKAKSKILDGIEYFSYDTIVHTKNPNAHLFGDLVGNGDITLDYTIHLKEDQVHTRNHGYIFKIKPTSFRLMFPEPERLDL